MVERRLHAHPHAHHTHPGETLRAPAVFPVAAENLLLRLASDAASNFHALPPILSDDEIANLDTFFAADAIRARLGDVYPSLEPSQHAAVTLGFAAAYGSLPESHARYQHARHGHGHTEDDDGCTKTHGPLRRTLDTLEHAVIGRITNDNARHLAAAAFRGSALLFCPGDDLAALACKPMVRLPDTMTTPINTLNPMLFCHGVRA